MGTLLDLASLVVVPSGYKEDKIYSVVPTDGSGDLDFTRASDATRVNSAGLIESVATGVPRLDYSQGSCPSLLLEPQRTNLLLRSEEFDNDYWTKAPSVQVVTSGSVLNKRGVTSQKLEFISGSLRRLFRTFSYVSGTTYTLSIFAKSDGVANLRLRLQDSVNNAFTAGKDIEFDLINGTVTAETGYVASIIPQGDGWFRCIVTATCTASVSDNIGVWVLNATTAGEGIYIDAIQLEEGSNATSYIPTLGTSVTRVADAASKTGISSLIGQTQGTLFAEVDIKANSNLGTILSLGSDTSVYLAILKKANNTIGFEVLNSGVQANISSAAFSDGVFKIAAAYSANDFVLYVNGAQVGTDTNGTVPTTSKVTLGAYPNNSFILSDGISQALLFKTRLSNTELASITTL